jgi:hypothetical protein
MPPRLTFNHHWLARYAAALAAVGAGLLLRQGLTALVGEGLPTYITFYPVIMAVALLGGFGPGLLATFATALAVDYWLLPPVHALGIASLVDAVGLAFFTGMGVFMSVVAELYRRARQKVVAHDTQVFLREGREAPPRLSGQGLLLSAGLVASLTVLAAVGWRSARNMGAVAEADRWEAHAHLVIQEWDRLLSALKDAETGQRGYLLTGEEKYLEPYQAALGREQTNLADLRQLTQDNPRQQQRVTGIEALIQEKLAELKQTIEIRRAQGLPPALVIVETDKGKIVMDQIRQQIAEAEDEEARLLQQRAAVKRAEVGETLQALLAGGVFSLILLTTVFLFLIQENRRRRQAEAELRRHRNDLQKTVTARTVDLSQANESLRKSEQQFRTLAESIPNLAWRANGDGYITWYNQRWYEYTGTTPEQMEGWGWQSVHDPHTLPAVLERWKASLATAQPFDMTFPLRGADGVFRPFLTRVMPLQDAQGRVQQWFGTNTDISDQIQAEKTEQRLNAELRQRVAELQAANDEVQASRRAALSLAEDALEARKQAERVNADLQKANQSLDASHRAALNLMDDAVRARRRAEQAGAELRRVAEQRRLALEAADLGAWDYHFRTGDVFWDQRCREMWGIPQSDHVDYSAAISRIHPDDRVGVDAAVKEALAGRDGGHYHREFRVVWPNGSVHWVASHGHVYFQGEGNERKPIRFIGANLEITLQKEAQAALQAANEELERRVAARTAELRTKSLYARSLLEASLDPLVTISPDGEITDVNRATEEVTGISRERLVGTDFSDYFTEPAKAEAGYQQVLAEGLVRDYPLTIRHASGRTTDVLYNATVYRDEAGAVQGVFAAARDITERKQAERRRDFTTALLGLFAQKSAAPDYLHSVMDVIRRWTNCQAIGIRILDEHGEIPYETCAGFEPEFLELENRLSLKRDNCCCIRAISQAFEEPDQALVTPGGSYRCDDAIAYADSLPPEKRARFRGNCMKFGFASLAVIPICYRDAVIGAVHLADHRPAQFPLPAVEFLEAMTPLIGEAMHRFQTEAELARHRDQLEVLVRQRTAELTDANTRLQQTAEDLKRSNRDLEQFAYVASHDLQEPLRAVGGYVKLLERRLSGSLDDRAREFIAGAFEGAVRMERLIRDLLAFSRAGSRGGEFVPTDLGVGLQWALNNLHASINSAQATITHDPLPTVNVDGTQIMQVFQNLIGNALKFHGETPPIIHVGAQRQEGRWVFSVRDNGIGIEPEYFEKIFQLFQRLHTRKQYAGTGIGLAICKRIVERHGGTIWVESQPGQGSTFYFSIPEATAR